MTPCPRGEALSDGKTASRVELGEHRRYSRRAGLRGPLAPATERLKDACPGRAKRGQRPQFYFPYFYYYRNVLGCQAFAVVIQGLALLPSRSFSILPLDRRSLEPPKERLSACGPRFPYAERHLAPVCRASAATSTRRESRAWTATEL